MTRFVFLTLSIVLCLSAESTRGQTEPTPLTSVEEVLRVKPGDAGRRDLPVKLKGVIVSLGPVPQRLSVHDGRATVVVIAPKPMPDLRMGQSVEVEGQVSSWQAGSRTNRMIAAKTITPGAIVPLPAPKAIGLNALNAFAELDQWVSTEGYVASWRRKSPFLTLTIVSSEITSTVTVWLADHLPIPTNLHGAKLRLTGINTFTNNLGESLGITTVDQMEVLEPGTVDAYEAPLVSIANLNARKVEPARRLRVRGTLITVMEAKTLIVQDEAGDTTALQIAAPRAPGAAATIYGDGGPLPPLQPGDVVEVVGSVIDQPIYAMKTWGMVLCYARVVGKGKVPEPEKMSVEQLLAVRNAARWVTFEATIGAWMFQAKTMMYAVADPTAEIIFGVRDSPVPDPFPRNLYGARARFTGLADGLYLTSSGCGFIVPNPSFVEILKSGREDSFEVKEYSASDIVNDRFPPGEQVKAKGLIVGRDGNTLYVRGNDAALCAAIQLPWSRPANTTGMYFADCGPVPEIKVGDVVEIMGTPIRSRSKTRPMKHDLTSTNVRVLGHQEKVEPVATTFTRIANGEHTHDLVEVRGRLLTWQVAPLGGSRWSTTMLLKGDGTKMTFVHESAVLHPFDTLKPTDDVLLQAVVERATEQTPRRLRLLSPADARSLGLSTEIIALKIWFWGGLAALIFGILGGWVLLLRRSHRRQAKVTAELMRAEEAMLAMNQTLEKRVHERTSELELTQANLQRALDQERELGELKSRFVTMVSHEFRTPLGIIMSAVELLQHYSDRLPDDEKQRQLQEIQSSTKHMGGLMEQVLLLGRAEAGKLTCKPLPLDIACFAERIIDETQSISNRKCPIILQTKGDITNASADEALLRHILGNLIANAVKYSPDGSEVVLRIHRAGNEVHFDVIDCGIGIPEKDRVRLFEAFHRCSNVGDTPGTGLGLVIVKRCVDLHGGSMDVASTPGRGTTFTVRLPLFP